MAKNEKDYINEITELKAEIDAFQMSENEANEIIAELKAENEQLKALCDTYRTCYQAKHSDIKCLLPKYRMTLQEIKDIAKENHFYFVEGAIVSYETIKQLATNFEKILDLITKAESEG